MNWWSQTSDGISPCGWASSTLLSTGTEQKGGGRRSSHLVAACLHTQTQTTPPAFLGAPRAEGSLHHHLSQHLLINTFMLVGQCSVALEIPDMQHALCPCRIPAFPVLQAISATQSQNIFITPVETLCL